ncbi:Peptidase family S41 [Dyadobacter sp. SG02]|uniref:S41 family peptidase n=1 Tax=Dyadobacter sp. SG02 TaxID=1855291 RepID=UPI0008BB3C62|nr:S41 family peptidase [Dyadobacter sp. SG02]SEJ84041.1 Peptidase family S41 [Dyadobacter sp. SG02]
MRHTFIYLALCSVLMYSFGDSGSLKENFPAVGILATCAGGGSAGGTGQNDDFDSDGICNLVDIDDDNDGVLDAVESPGCFYSAGEASVISSVSTPRANDDGVNVDLPFLHDGVTTTVTASNNVIAINEAINGAVIYNFEYPTEVKLTSVSHYGTTFGTSATAMIQGSNDQNIWNDLMTAATAATANPKTFTVNNNAANSYRYYRIVKVAGTSTPAVTTYEISAIVNSTGFTPSAHPKAICTNDLDNDTFVNHMDPDSDGDGCSDALEAGTTTNTANNFTFNPITDSNANGFEDALQLAADGNAYKASYTYSYAANKAYNVCSDSDSDGVKDVADLDDDNDGVLDAVESPACFYTAAEAGTVAYVSTLLTNDDGIHTDLPFMHDGVTTSVSASNNVIAINQVVNGAVIYTFEYQTPVKLTSISHNGTTFGTGATAMIQGSNDQTTWADLMTAATAATANPKTFTVNTNADNSYKYYRIVKVAGTTAPAITTYEISSVQNVTGYIASAHPKAECTTDADNHGTPNHQDLELVIPDGRVREVTLPATHFENTQCPAYKTANNAKPLEFNITDSTRAVLTIRTFSKDRVSNAGQDFPVFLQTAFEQIQQRNIQHLFIDLRGNGGGDDVYGALLYSYLTSEPFRYFSTLQSRSKPLMTPEDHPGLALQQPANVSFGRKVYVLIDGRTFSTAADFCAITRSNARGVFIGEETGGGYEGNNSGGTVRVDLPHSGIRLAVPTVKYSNAVTPGNEPGRGIIADYPVSPSIGEMLAEKDVQLQKALEIALP